MTRPTIIAALASLLTTTTPLPALADFTTPTRSEAADRFDRAIRLIDSGDLNGGLAEFLRAYALVPSPVLLYNLGLVYAALHRPVDAARALEKALSQRQTLRVEEIERAQSVLREQGDKIGQVAVSTNVKEGVIEIDNIEATKLPLSGPLDMSVGPHVVGLVAPGYAPARREVIVAGRERVETHLDLVAIEGLLAHIAVTCRVPAADVLVDGERVGKTPLERTVTVAPGAHQVEVRRAGYVPVTRAITLQDGARGDLAMTPAIDTSALGRQGGWLVIGASETQSVVSVDGDEVGLLTGPIRLPAGPHRLHVERGGFLPAERDVEMPLGATTSVSVVFEPTPDTRARHVASAESRRAWSWATIGAGVAIAAGGVILALVEQHDLTNAQGNLDTANADWIRGSGRSCDFSTLLSNAQMAACVTRLNDATSAVSDIETRRTAGWIVAGAGGAILVTGVALLVTGDSPHKYDEKPVERTLAGWRITPALGMGGLSVRLHGQF